MTAIAALISPKPRDLGEGFVVRRALPAIEKRAVASFVFLDQMGPVAFGPGQGLDVRPHPHIGLATVTCLFEGEILHRDSLGFVQEIRPGDVNWMTAGRGIVHSERTSPEVRAAGGTLYGLQLWVALPKAHEETEPRFVHHPAATLPAWRENGARLRLIVGEAFGRASPVETFSDLFYVDAQLDAGADIVAPEGHDERAIYVVEGHVRVDGEDVEAGKLAVLSNDARTLSAVTAARFVIIGGAALDAPRHMWWNFVSSSADRIEQAKADWRDGRFGKVPGDDEFIPLPER
ncbi:MAG: hypothetical protein GC189_12825 [Alphaproteobacteria bacterium]|nr:hypothetical protein [Alphaproteobacteria bacterium]